MLQRLDALEQRVGALQQSVASIQAVGLATHNMVVRAHNRTNGFGTDGHLLPLRSERVGDTYGQLPPEGLFPACAEEIYNEARPPAQPPLPSHAAAARCAPA